MTAMEGKDAYEFENYEHGSAKATKIESSYLNETPKSWWTLRGAYIKIGEPPYGEPH